MVDCLWACEKNNKLSCCAWAWGLKSSVVELKVNFGSILLCRNDDETDDEFVSSVVSGFQKTSKSSVSSSAIGRKKLQIVHNLKINRNWPNSNFFFSRPSQTPRTSLGRPNSIFILATTPDDDVGSAKQHFKTRWPIPDGGAGRPPFVRVSPSFKVERPQKSSVEIKVGVTRFCAKRFWSQNLVTLNPRSITSHEDNAENEVEVFDEPQLPTTASISGKENNFYFFDHSTTSMTNNQNDENSFNNQINNEFDNSFEEQQRLEQRWRESAIQRQRYINNKVGPESLAFLGCGICLFYGFNGD